MATFNNIGSMDLERGFPYGSHTWKPPMDRNLKKLAYAMNGFAKSKTVDLPTDAPVGDVYIAKIGDPQQGAILISNGGDNWDVVQPRQGLSMLIEDEGTLATYFGGSWGRASVIDGTPPNDRLTISSFHPGEPGNNYFFLRRITAAQERILAAGPHAAYSEAPAIGAPGEVYIAHNGITIGTVTFPVGVKEGVVAIGSDFVLDAGSILTFRTGNANGIQDFCVTIGGRREFDVT